MIKNNPHMNRREFLRKLGLGTGSAKELTQQLKARRPDDSTARWAFRWVGSHPNILTTLSGMNRMEHLIENVETFSPLEVCTEAENALLADIADQMSGFPTIPVPPANTACPVLTA